MKRRLAIALALFASACSQAGGPDQARDVAEEPSIAPSAAPGVAFRYAYMFELPDDAISEVQEKHAARCESLGINKCRITGLTYSVNEDDAVHASLTVKLEPAIARQFGKEATEDVRSADGRLRTTEFSGEDTEPTTTQATRQQSDLQTRIAEVEKQLASTTNDRERTQLQSQLNELRAQLSQAQATIAGTQQMLAVTPMTFNYYGRGGISGFRTNPAREAARLFVSSLVTMVTFVLRLIAVLLPWSILLLVLVLIARSKPGRAVWRYFAPKPSDGEQDG
ncbi:MAG: DUF4349 domain-containing protein [Alphaproteobacteria bacterium]